MTIHLLLDNADPRIWHKYANLGVFKGITTNPTLLKQAGQGSRIENLQSLATQAEQLEYEEIHFQTFGETKSDLLIFARSISELKKEKLEIKVKIPITINGIHAAKALISEGISITFTACYEAKQVLIAAAVGATYIAPYMGRITDQGKDGLQEIIAMQNVLMGTGSSCKLLVASLRDINDIAILAKNGIKTFTLNDGIANELFHNSSTAEAAIMFDKDAKSIAHL